MNDFTWYDLDDMLYLSNKQQQKFKKMIQICKMSTHAESHACLSLSSTNIAN